MVVNESSHRNRMVMARSRKVGRRVVTTWFPGLGSSWPSSQVRNGYFRFMFELVWRVSRDYLSDHSEDDGQFFYTWVSLSRNKWEHFTCITSWRRVVTEGRHADALFRFLMVSFHVMNCLPVLRSSIPSPCSNVMSWCEKQPTIGWRQTDMGSSDSPGNRSGSQ